MVLNDDEFTLRLPVPLTPNKHTKTFPLTANQVKEYLHNSN